MYWYLVVPSRGARCVDFVCLREIKLVIPGCLLAPILRKEIYYRNIKITLQILKSDIVTTLQKTDFTFITSLVTR